MNPLKKLFLLLLLAFTFTNGGQAKFKPEKIFTKNILFKEGLSQCVITDIVQDKKGFVWAASYDGLNRFDGQNIKVFRQTLDFINSQLEEKKYYKIENSYKYLTDMKIHSFSEDTINILTEKMNTLTHEYTTISNMTLKDFWRSV